MRTVSPSITVGDDTASAARTRASLSITAAVASHVGRASLERAGCCQPRNGRAVDGISTSDFSHRLASVQASQRFLALMRRHLPRTTETHAARFGAFAALTGASANQLTLEL